MQTDATKQTTDAAPTPVLLMSLGRVRVMAAEADADQRWADSDVAWAAVAALEAALAERGVEGVERDVAVAEVAEATRALRWKD